MTRPTLEKYKFAKIIESTCIIFPVGGVVAYKKDNHGDYFVSVIRKEGIIGSHRAELLDGVFLVSQSSGFIAEIDDTLESRPTNITSETITPEVVPDETIPDIMDSDEIVHNVIIAEKDHIKPMIYIGAGFVAGLLVGICIIA